ncbi:MAG: alpha/beta fold hydrolase [Bdellovibrionota bacterium]
MIHENIKKITAVDGHVMTMKIYSPTNAAFHESNCDGVILAVHGLTEYAERYRNVAEFTCQKNKIFANFDSRGHGYHAKKRGDVENFSCFILDIIQAFKTLKNFFPQIKNNSFAIFGHSFGGLLATYTASILADELKHLFLCAPGYASKQKIPSWKVLLANNVAQLFPRLSVPIGFKQENLSNNSTNNLLYKNDPLILTHLTARFGKILLDAMSEQPVQAALENVTADVTLLLPSDDKIVDLNVIRNNIKSLKTSATICEVEGAGHEIFNEGPDLQKIAFSHYEKWLEKI